MVSEPGREPRSSPTTPNPLGAWVGAFIFLLFAFFSLFLTALGITGVVFFLLDGHFSRETDDYLILGLSGGFFSAVFLMIVDGFRAMAKRDRRAWRLAAGRCPRCGYDIRNLPEPRCPECGETWPADEVKER
jgi:hypothetical protein